MGIPWRDTLGPSTTGRSERGPSTTGPAPTEQSPNERWSEDVHRATQLGRELTPDRDPPERVIAERRVLPRRREFVSSSEQHAARRLGRVALWALPLTLAHLFALRLAEGRADFGWWPELTVVALQLGLVGAARSSADAAVTLKRCAALTVALGWALSWHWYARVTDALLQLTPVSLLVVLLPLLVPLRPRFTVGMAALAAASQTSLAASLLAGGRLPGSLVDLSLSAFGALSATALAAVSAAVTSWSRSDLARDIGGYRLIRKLGAGGAGEVWEGRHRLLARPAAVKLLSPPTMSRTFLVRFEREAQATALLSSEHTVSLYDFGITHGGLPYYVMELLVGFDLQRLVEELGPLPPARVVLLMKQACDSLGEAHEYGIAHRDIKPSNLFLSRRGLGRDFLKVLDFGMVSAQEETEDSTNVVSSLSQDGYLYGTPAYMPAEQAQGRPVDTRADLYQLGCVMYFLLTGRVVFEKRSPLALAVAHASEVPEAPSRVAPQEIPPELDALVLRCLEKDPDRRIQTAQELLDRLRQIRCSEPWSPERAAAWWRTHAPLGSDQRTTLLRALRKRAL